MITDKYKMSQKENILYAKRNIIDYIYNSAKLEGLKVTFPQTQAIYNKLKIDNTSVDFDEVNKILNLKHAWQYIIKNIDKEINLGFISRVHEEVAKDEALEWGKIRTGQVSISGTYYIPPIPQKKDVEEQLSIFNKDTNITNRAIDRMLYMMKSQIFWDGNKRTATIIANKDLICNGAGIISVKETDLYNFNILLTNFYNDDRNKNELKNFLYEKSIDGMSTKKI
ncbi:MAG: Fic family protein [Peptoniphilaceae bacterium]|nr:Fic family protein [Peptoniphilaceae bacterium]MDY6018033.1 Fic family protein [Anaerococcus sp.]